RLPPEQHAGRKTGIELPLFSLCADGTAHEPGARRFTEFRTMTDTTKQSDAPAAAGHDYKKTGFLPQPESPMRAALPQREPEILKRWNDIDLYRKLRESAK